MAERHRYPIRISRERGAGSNYLLLAINVVILVVAVFWIWQRLKASDGGAEDANAAEQANGYGVDGVNGESRRIRGDDGLGRVGRGLPTAKNMGGGLPQVRAGVAYLDGDGDVVEWDDETLRAVGATETTMGQLEVWLEVARAVKGEYPSSKRDFGANRGIESAFEILNEMQSEKLAALPTKDTDGDGRPEFVDAWGRPLVYFSSDDYGNSQDVAGATVAAVHSARVDAWTAPERFQLWSYGADGNNAAGLEDDRASWVIRE